MKKHFFALVIVLTVAGQLAQAQTIRRVNNSGATGPNIYLTIQAAHDAATAGDIIQLEPTTVSYGDLVCNRSVRIVGPGYFLAANSLPALQANPQTAIVNEIDFVNGSSGASVMGLTANYIRANTSNLAIQRNAVGLVQIGRNATANNIIVRQNYLDNLDAGNNAGFSLLVTNNIIRSQISMNYGSGEFLNNVALGGGTFNTYVLRNNYIGINSSFSLNTANTSLAYNLYEGALPAANASPNSLGNVPLSTVFVLSPGPSRFDAWYQLKGALNPALGAGENGVDIGAFGGGTGNDYRLSGIPPIPTIYRIDESPSGNNLNVSIGTRSNN